jgi:hypothetical protein
MGEQFFDDLARGLHDGTISRGRALRWLGAGAVALAIGPLFPEQAEALTRRQRRRCRRKGGIPLEKGTCHCAITCDFSSDEFTCQGNPGCTCFMTVTGRGFCAGGSRPSGCSSSEDCESSLNEVACVVNPGCPGSGASCTTSEQCRAINQFYGCVNGTCQLTACASPCPR